MLPVGAFPGALATPRGLAPAYMEGEASRAGPERSLQPSEGKTEEPGPHTGPEQSPSGASRRPYSQPGVPLLSIWQILA